MLEGRRRERAELAASAGQRIAGDAPEAMTVGENGQAFTTQRAYARHRLDGFEQIAERIDADPTGTAQCGVVNIGGSKWPTALVPAAYRAGLDGDHRFVAGSRARCRHELAPHRDFVELHQNRMGIRVGGQPVEHVGEIDVEIRAEVQHRREADALAVGPIENGRRQGCRLRNQRDLARRDRNRSGAGIQPDGRHDKTTTARPENAYQIRLGCFLNGLARFLDRAGTHLVPHPRPDDHGTGATGAELLDDRRHQIQRSSNDGQIGRDLEFAEADIVANVDQRAFFCADRHDRAIEAASQEIGQHHLCIAARLVGFGDHRDRSGAKKVFEVAGSHGFLARGALLINDRKTRSR